MQRLLLRKLSGQFKASLAIVALLLFYVGVVYGGQILDNMNVRQWIKIGGTGAATSSAALEISSTTKGFVLSRMTQAQRDAISATQGLYIYNTDSGRNEFFDGSSWHGDGARYGVKNYLGSIPFASEKNGDFESGTVGSWVLGHATLTSNLPTGTPTFGTGASVNLSGSILSFGSQIAGVYSYGLSSSAATTAGDMLESPAFSIDAADQAKVLRFSFSYKFTSGTGNWSGTTANSFGVAIYDVTNGTWVIPAGIFSMTQSSGVGRATGTFQTASNGSSYRFVVYNANATSGAAGITFDDFFLGPQMAPIGSVTTDWQSFTPTGAWSTNTTYTGKWRRVGDTGFYDVNISLAGAPTAASLTVNLPSGQVMDTTKMTNSTGAIPEIGQWGATHGGLFQVGSIYYSSTTSVGVAYLASASVATITTVSNTVPFTWASTDVINLRWSAPIVGWSSNVQMSNDTDTRVVAMQVSQAVPTATITSSYSLVKFTAAPTQDTHGGFSTSTGLYTVPVSGFYRATFEMNIQGTFTTGLVVGASIFKNGVENHSQGWVMPAGTLTSYPFITYTVYCNAGDTLGPYALSTGSSNTVPSAVILNYFAVERLSGPSVVAATESVNFATSDTAGGSIPTSPAIYKYATITFDSHGAYSSSTGLWTAPVSGKYQVNATLGTAGVTLSTAQGFNLYLYKNGSQFYLLNQTVGSGGTTIPYIASGSAIVSLLAGDTLAIWSQSTVATTASTNGVINHWSVTRIGN